jgi:hypothetical protein
MEYPIPVPFGKQKKQYAENITESMHFKAVGYGFLLQLVTFTANQLYMHARTAEALHIIYGLPLAAAPGTLKVQLQDIHLSACMFLSAGPKYNTIFAVR